MRLAAGTTPQPTMTSKLQLGEHIKTISGRKYIYSSKIRKRGGKAEQRYERPLDRKQQKTMEHLSKKDKGIIERAFQKGVAVRHALGSRVAASTVYAYMTRHGVPREKRDVRIDKGKKRK
jgi:hypothetical protein